MSFTDYFSDWENKTLTILNYTRPYNETTGAYGEPTYVAADPAVTISGTIWNKSAREAYISEQFREDVTDIFRCERGVVVANDSRLTDGSTVWSVETDIDVANQGNVRLIGMKKVAA